MSNPRVLIQYDATETNAQQVDANNAAHVHILDASGNPYFTAANPAHVQATDLDIRDLSSTQDSVEVVGVKPDGTNTQPSMDAVARAGYQIITDGTEVLLVNADGSTNSVVTATDLDIRDLTSVSDSVEVVGVKPDGTNTQPSMDVNTRAGFVQVTDGVDDLGIESDGSLPITIKSPLESNGAVPVNIQDQHSEVVDFCLYANEVSWTLASNTALDDTTITATGGHGISVGDLLVFEESSRMSEAVVLTVVTNTITIDRPMDFAYTTAATCLRGTTNLNVDGSSTPVIAKVSAPAGVEWDIVRTMIYIQDGSTPGMDDSKFGGITALTNGCTFRIKNAIYKNLFNIKKNGDFGLRMYDTIYVDSAPAGSEGFRARRTFGGPSKNGVVIRLDGDDNEEFQVIISDDLTGLEEFSVIVQGHLVTN